MNTVYFEIQCNGKTRNIHVFYMENETLEYTSIWKHYTTPGMGRDARKSVFGICDHCIQLQRPAIELKLCVLQV